MGWVANIVLLLAGTVRHFAALSVAAAFAISSSLTLSGSSAAAETCQNWPWAAEPCPGVVQKWQSFLELQELHASLAAARSFEAFLAGRDEEAMHFLGLARGDDPRSGMTMGNFGSPEAARLLRRREAGCTADPYASNPCLGAAGAWQRYANEKGLSDGWENSRGFIADLNGRSRSSTPAAGSGSTTMQRATEMPPSPGGRLIIRVYPGAGFEGS